MSDQLNAYRLEWGKFFRTIETVQDEARTEHELEQKLMRDRPEIFPVQIKRVLDWDELGGGVVNQAARLSDKKIVDGKKTQETTQ